MKASSFVISLSLTLLLILVVSIGIWKNSDIKKPLKLDIHKLEVPNSGKYIPKNAYLTFHFNIDPNQIPKYLASFAKQNKRKLALKNGYNLRNGLFALIGLDFEQDLSNWISSKISFSILNTKEIPKQKEWLLTLQGIENDGVRNFLSSYWEKQDANGIEIEKEEFEGQYIINEKADSRENNDRKIAMSLFENNLLIVASNKKVIKDAIILSSNPIKSQLYDEELKDTIRKLDHGSALITCSPEALQSFFQIPPLVAESLTTSGFAASIKAEGRSLFLDSYFKTVESPNSTESQLDNKLLSESYDELNLHDIAIIKNPQQILDKDKTDIYSKLLGDIFRESLLDLHSPIANTIIGMEQGKLLLAKNGKGWLLGVKNNDQFIKISKMLENEGFNKSILKLDNKMITVWSKIISRQEDSNYQLLSQIEAIFYQDPYINFWTNDISMLEQVHRDEQIHQVQPINLKPEIEVTQKISLEEDSANQVLNTWKPWQIIRTGINRGANLKAKHLLLDLGEDNKNDESALSLQGILAIN